MHEHHGIRLALLTLGLSLGLFMNLLDTSIANVSIPYIAGSLNVSPTQGTWVITSFSASTAILLPLTGWLALRFGEVRLFIISTTLFTIASVLCGLSWNLSMLIFSRILQGIFAAPMIPLSQSLLLSHYPADKKGLATGLWVMTAVLAPILGPALGGYITYDYAWPWIFYVNVPIGMLSVYLSWMLLKGEETPIKKLPIDRVGLCLFTITIACLQITLDKGHELDWYSSTTIQLLTVIGIVSAILFFIWEIYEKYPIIDLSLFRIRNFSIGVSALFLGQCMFFGSVIMYTLWLQTQMGYTSMWAGLAAMPIGFLALFFTPVVGLYLYRFPAQWFAMFGFLVLALSCFLNSLFNTDSSIWQLSQPRFLVGLGLSFFISPVFYIIVSRVESNRVTSALGIANFMRTLGASVGTSVYVTLWENREKFHYARLVESLSDYHMNAVAQLQQFNFAGISSLSSKAILDQVVAKQAFLLSVNELFWVSGFLFVMLSGLMLFVKSTRSSSEQHIMAE